MDSLFTRPEIKILSDSDFMLETEYKLTLRDKDCCLVLFHDNQYLSVELVKLWQQIANIVAGPKFMICDLVINRNIANAMSSSPYIQSNPFSWISTVKIPVIIVYRQGFPQGAYNGIISVDNLISYASKTACNPSYHECQIIPNFESKNSDKIVYEE